MLMLCQTWFCTPWAWMGDKLELIQPPISATNSITTGTCEEKMSPRTISNTPQRLKVAQATVDLKWQQSIDSKWWFSYALMIDDCLTIYLNRAVGAYDHIIINLFNDPAFRISIPIHMSLNTHLHKSQIFFEGIYQFILFSRLFIFLYFSPSTVAICLFTRWEKLLF